MVCVCFMFLDRQAQVSLVTDGLVVGGCPCAGFIWCVLTSHQSPKLTSTERGMHICVCVCVTVQTLPLTHRGQANALIRS